MFKYYILIKFTNLTPSLKKRYPFWRSKHVCCHQGLLSIQSYQWHQVRFTGPRQPATCLYPIKTLPKVVESWKVLHIFVYEHCSLFLETLNVCDHQCPSPDVIPFRVRRLSMHCRGVPRRKLSPFAVLPKLSVTKTAPQHLLFSCTNLYTQDQILSLLLITEYHILITSMHLS